MKRVLLFIAIITLHLTTNAQVVDGKVSKEYKKAFNSALGKWYDQNYRAALVEFKVLEDQYPDNAYIKFVIGDCYIYSSREKNLAIQYLEKACKSMVEDMTFFDYSDERNSVSPFTAMKQLGIAYRINYEFEKAITYFNKYKGLWGENITEEEKKEVEREIAICKTGIQLVSNPVNIKITNLGSELNSEFPEYAPVVTADEKTIIFTSRRGEGDEGLADDYMYFEDIYIASKKEDDTWGEAYKISENINSPGHEASIGLSVDGQQLLIYSSQEDHDGDIYLSTLDGDIWSVPQAFGPVNSADAETHACFNVDGTAVYFTSNRSGGYGGFDLYKVTKLPNGEWSLPLNLGPTINTEYDETAPFMHPDGITLFFSSNGHETMGGYDIFETTVDEESFTWRKPKNVGYPINTTTDDVFYVTSVDASRAYYASEKQGGEGEKDLYLITLVDKKPEEKALTVMTGVFSMGDNKDVPDDAQITVKDAESGEILGIYKPNSKTGKYLFILPPGKTYDVSYEVEGYLFKSENLIVPTSSSFDQIEKEINLAPVQANESVVMNNVFFKYDKDVIIDESLPDLEKMAKLLNKNKKITIEISGHTDSKGADDYNMRLSEKRAQAVKAYLIKNGVDANRISAVGKGETMPIARNENPDGSDNPEGRQLNRRIELKVLSTDGSITNDSIKKIEVPDELKKD